MKNLKVVVVVSFLLLVSSVCFAGERRVASSVTSRSFAGFDPSYEQAHVCSSQSADCNIPIKVLDSTVEIPVLHIDVYVPTTQVYSDIYIVSDTAGTIVFLTFFNDFLLAGFNAFDLDSPLPPGDYTFTSIAVGADGNTSAISDPYKFSVR